MVQNNYMKTKEKKVLIGGLILLGIVVVFLFFNRKKEVEIVVPFEQNYTEEKTEPVIPIKNQKNRELKTIQSENNIKVTLSVLDKKYDIQVKERSTVFETMNDLEKQSSEDNPFSFKYTNNLSMGNFIIEINGVKGTPGKYWIYYVDDKLASIGVSKYVLKEGDIINWKNEGM
jgi:hypothetical protein